MLSIGQKAPQFTVRDTDKKEHSLSQYYGQNIVLLFFPLAFSSVCTKELCGVRDEISEYQILDSEIIAISVDSLYSLHKFKQEQGFQFTLLSDWNKDVSRSYGTIYEDFGLGMKGVSKRSAFVIDKKGMIRYAEVLENAGEIPNFEKIKEVLKELAN